MTNGPRPTARPMPPAAFLLAGAGIAWASWSMLAEMQRKWSTDPTYSHGYLVPLLSLWILWARRASLPQALPRPSWWGVPLIALGATLQAGGAYLYVRWLSGAAILAYLAGLALLVGGGRGLRWAAPAIGFLSFMIPLPYRVEVLLKQPLQQVSTMASAFALETAGIPALAEGNVIVLDNVNLGIVDACSGLKMLIVFFALSTATAILSHRSVFEKVLIVISAAPIAIISNVVRITATGILYETSSSKWANLVYHDLAGWLMMPLALALLWAELWLLSLLISEEPPAADEPLFTGLGLAGAKPAA